MSKRTEILVSGYGGQGVVRFGQILGQAAVYQGLFTTMLISHGTETRGGYVRSQVVISDSSIDSPNVEHPDFFCAFSSVAYGMFKNLCGANSLIIYEADLVAPDISAGIPLLAVSAEKIAENEFGSKVFANIIFLGVLSRRLEQVSSENILKAVKSRLPANVQEKNKKAFELGRNLMLLETGII